MTTAADVKKFAMSLPGATEVDHFGRPSFRTKKRIFAVIRPDGLFLHLPDERKEFLFEAAPDTFVKYMWGKTANVIVQLGMIEKRELEGLIREAYESALPPVKPKRPAKAKRKARRP
jgi:hypothetical protein